MKRTDNKINWDSVIEEIFSESIENSDYTYSYGYWVSRKELKLLIKDKTNETKLTANNIENCKTLTIEAKTRKIKQRLYRGYIISRVEFKN